MNALMLHQPNNVAAFGKGCDAFGDRFAATLMLTGDTLPLAAALLGSGPLRPVELALHTGIDEASVRTWLAAQAVRGYVDYDAGTGSFHLSPALHSRFGEKEVTGQAAFADLQIATWEDAAFD